MAVEVTDRCDQGHQCSLSSTVMCRRHVSNRQCSRPCMAIQVQRAYYISSNNNLKNCKEGTSNSSWVFCQYQPLSGDCLRSKVVVQLTACFTLSTRLFMSLPATASPTDFDALLICNLYVLCPRCNFRLHCTDVVTILRGGGTVASVWEQCTADCF